MRNIVASGLVHSFSQYGPLGRQITYVFYFRPSKSNLSFEKVPECGRGCNKLNGILPEMCKAAGLKRKTNHCLRVTCVSSLFNAGVEEKLIQERAQ